MIMKVDPDNGICSGQLGAENHTESNAPYSENDDGFTRFELGIVVDDAESRRKRVGKQAAQLEIGVRRNFGQTIFRNDRIFLECGDRTGIHIPSFQFVDDTSRIDPRSRTPMADDPVSGRDMRHVLTNLKNDSPSFMSEEMRKKFIRTLDPIDLADLRSANARGVDFDQHLPALERRQLDFVDDQRLALLNQNGGGRFQNTVLATD